MAMRYNTSSVGILQNAPTNPARATTRIRTPKIMAGHSRTLTQESPGSVVSLILTSMIGIERSTATKLMVPMKLLVSAILVRLCLNDFVFLFLPLRIEHNIK
ncbi:hypothetical protein AAZV13_08G245800 [Glycine max]